MKFKRLLYVVLLGFYVLSYSFVVAALVIETSDDVPQSYISYSLVFLRQGLDKLPRGIELEILLPQPPKEGYRHESVHLPLFYVLREKRVY